MEPSGIFESLASEAFILAINMSRGRYHHYFHGVCGEPIRLDTNSRLDFN
jgi:hypothetical protein